jgi:hypothetical protein
MKCFSFSPFTFVYHSLIFMSLISIASCKKSTDAGGTDTSDNTSVPAGQMTLENIPGSSIQYTRQLDPNTQQVILEGYKLDGKKTGQWTQSTIWKKVSF